MTIKITDIIKFSYSHTAECNCTMNLMKFRDVKSTHFTEEVIQKNQLQLNTEKRILQVKQMKKILATKISFICFTYSYVFNIKILCEICHITKRTFVNNLINIELHFKWRFCFISLKFKIFFSSKKNHFSRFFFNVCLMKTMTLE